MLQEQYEINIETDFQTYEFQSIGSKGNITKVVSYTEINVKGYYNLGFGDNDLVTGYVSDLKVTNNGDSKKVLATVSATLYAFSEKHPKAIVIATGSTQARTRLYRMGIANNLKEIEKDFITFFLQKKQHTQHFYENVPSRFLLNLKL